MPAGARGAASRIAASSRLSDGTATRASVRAASRSARSVTAATPRRAPRRRSSSRRPAPPDRSTAPSRTPGARPRATPPGNRIDERRSARPASCAATAIAHAPLPQASVSPLPRSQTLAAIASGPTRANSTFVPSGKRSSRSSTAPMWETWKRSGSSSRKSTRCGFPIDTAVARTTTPPPRSRDSSRNVSHAGPRIGIAAFVKFGSPMSTVTRPSSWNVTRRMPAACLHVERRPRLLTDVPEEHRRRSGDRSRTSRRRSRRRCDSP